MENSSNVVTQKESNVKLVLNGGSEIMDRATIPVEWHFGEKIREQKPRCLILCDHKMSIEELKNKAEHSFGTRYFCKIEDLVKYVQVLSPGKHHFVVLVICSDSTDQANEYAEEYMKLSEHHDSSYEKSIWYDYLKKEEIVENGRFKDVSIFVSAVEFEVPKELFAKKPGAEDSKWKRWIWKWANCWFKKEPTDECNYRKRKILAFTIKPFVFILNWIVLYLVVNLAFSLYVIIGGAILFFIGWKPTILTRLSKAWLDEKYNPDLKAECHWRLWRKVDLWIYMPIRFLPFVLVVEILIILSMGYFIILPLVLFIFSPVISLIITGILGILIFLKSYRFFEKIDDIGRMKKERLEHEQKKKIKKDLKWLEFLKANTALEDAPEKVDIGKIKSKLGFNKMYFRVSYWALKAQLCKPYAK